MFKIDGLFVLSAHPFTEAPELGYVEELCETWRFSHDGFHSFCSIYVENSVVAWLFGTPIDLEAVEVLTSRLDLKCDRSPGSIWTEITQRIAGSWVLILKKEDGIEIRQDACGTIGIVYDKKSGAAASHAYLLLGDTYEERLDDETRERHEVTSEGWVTGGGTAHHYIGRLLPNHALALPNCDVARLSLIFPAYDDALEPIVSDIAAEVRAVVSALSKSRKVHCSLTGGEDSRAILAALRPMTSDLRFITFAYPNSGLDVELATRLSKAANIEHVVLPSAKGGDPHLWLIGAGHAMAGNNKEYYPTASQLAGDYMVGGLGGEVGQGFLWSESINSRTTVTANEIIKRLKFPVSSELTRTIESWLDELPEDLDAFQIFDLAYVELRMACWAFAQPWMKPAPTRIHPLISYNQFHRMWQIPPPVRAEKGVSRIIIENQWAELLGVAINKTGNPIQDILKLIVRGFKRPDLIKRKLRQFLPPLPGR